MKNLIWILTGIMFICLNPGCIIDDDDNNNFGCIDGIGESISQVVDMESFTSIRLKVDADVMITQGPEQEVAIKAEENILEQIELDVSGNTWDIEFKDCVDRYDDLRIFITIPVIERLAVEGSGKIFGENLFIVNDLHLDISGSGDIDIAAEADEIDGQISGSGEITLEGTSDKVDFKISGSGDYHAFLLETNFADIEVSGSGDTEIRVLDQLDVKISGSGDVYYKGFPTVNVEINGSGKVIDAN